MTFVNGCSYVYTQHGKSHRVKLLRFDPITNRHVVTSNGGRTEHLINLHALAGRIRAVRTPTKMDTSTVYLYMCNVGNDTYKVGATCQPERRCKQIRTYTPLAKMKSVVRIPKSRGNQWAKIEKNVLRQFAAHRPATGGREVLRLNMQQAAACSRYMRSVCAGA